MVTKIQVSVNLDGDYVFSVSNVQYIASRSVSDVVLPNQLQFSLATVFTLQFEQRDELTAEWLETTVKEYENGDDVFNAAFLSTVIFCGVQEDEVELTSSAREYLQKIGTKNIIFVSSQHLLPGPYAVIGNELRDVWRLYDDNNGTCMTTLRPQNSSSQSFESFHLRSSDDQFISFALQSRIKSRANTSSPFGGMRILVKDNIHLRGIKTSVGNRAFYDTYPPQETTAECIERLLSLGATVVGKSKLTAFVTWEEPIEYIDYQAPWNPRADRHQSPGGSSSGSAAAVAAYPWIDIAIGTDTWASVTRPALWCGCFGLRPSLGTVSTKGVVPYCQKWDTPGILGRDLKLVRSFAAEWLMLDKLSENVKAFSSVIWPSDFWSVIDAEQLESARAFTKQVASSLGIECFDLSFKETWSESSPDKANGLSLYSFIDGAPSAQDYDAYMNSQNFRDQYWKQYHHAPYVSPRIRRNWESAKGISKESRDKGMAKIEVYKRWFQQIILSGKHSNALIVLPIESMHPRYRDTTPEFKRPPQEGINALALGPVLEAPVLAVPIGDMAYHSKVTDQEEKLPLAVALLASKGNDLALMDAALQALETAGLPTAVKTGKVMFD